MVSNLTSTFANGSDCEQKRGDKMARPMMDGLLYFPFDTDFFQDTKIRILRSRHGTDGVSVYIYLLCKIYANGYYVIYNEDLVLIMSGDLNISEDSTRLIISFLLSRSLLVEIKDSTLAQSDTVLTAKSIQERYQEAKKGLKRDVFVNADYWLLPEDKTLGFIKSRINTRKSEKNTDKSEINESKSEKNTANKIKEKEIKVNESKVNILSEIPAELSEWWKAFVEMRVKVKKPLTEHAKKLNYSKLMELSDGDLKKANAILQQSVMNSWQGLYPLKESDKQNKGSQVQQTSSYNLTAYEKKGLNLISHRKEQDNDISSNKGFAEA